MHRRNRTQKWFRLVLLTIGILCVMALPATAQSNDVTFTGDISEVTDTTIVVGGVAVDIATAVLPVNGVAVGMTVQVIGVVDGQTIRATLVVLTDAADEPAEETSEPQPETTPDVAPTAIPQQPAQPAVVINNAPIIVIEGPVQEININNIVIFDINIQVDPADEVLTQIRIGDTIRVEGQSNIENNVVIIVALNITIIETTVIVINNPGAVYVPIGVPRNCKLTGRGNGRITCKNTGRSSRRS